MNLSKITKVFLFVIFLSVLFFSISSTKEVSAESAPEVNIYIFWGEGCPHCAAAKPFLEQLAASNPGVHLMEFEIYNDDANLALLKKVSLEFGFTATKVPTIFIGDQYWEGYTEVIAQEIQEVVEKGLINGSPDIVASILAGEPLSLPEKEQNILPLIIVLAVSTLLIVVFVFARRKKPGKLQKN